MEGNDDKFEAVIRRKGDFSVQELDELFSGLSPVTIDEMIGEWRVGYLFTEGTGSRFETFLKYCPIRLYGKRFKAKNRVQAWLFRLARLKFGFPGTSAGLERVDFRGLMSTSMVYHYLPMIDHFRKVDGSAVMGIMEIKGKLSTYFYLKRQGP